MNQGISESMIHWISEPIAPGQVPAPFISSMPKWWRRWCCEQRACPPLFCKEKKMVHWFIEALTHQLIASLPHFTDSLIRWSFHWIIGSLIYWFSDSLVHRLTNLLLFRAAPNASVFCVFLLKSSSRYSLMRFLSTTFLDRGLEPRKHRSYFRDTRSHHTCRNTDFAPESGFTHKLARSRNCYSHLLFPPAICCCCLVAEMMRRLTLDIRP